MAKKCKYEKALRAIVEANQQFLRWLDAEMMRPSNVMRGQRIAQAMNAMNIAVDRARYFTLDIDYRRDKKSAFNVPFSAAEHAAFLRGLADVVEGKTTTLAVIDEAKASR